jgi:hypothetical protein
MPNNPVHADITRGPIKDDGMFIVVKVRTTVANISLTLRACEASLVISYVRAITTLQGSMNSIIIVIIIYVVYSSC